MEEMEIVKHKTPPQGKITFEEFLAWADEDTHAEWEDGQVIMASPASINHQKLILWISSILNSYVRKHKLGEVIIAPFLMRLQVTDQGREPDLIFLKTENLDRLQNTYLAGAADLVAEIVSPESISRDRGRKFWEYEQEGIPEYWLLDPIRRQAEFYRLGDDGHYHVTLPEAEGIYRSVSVAGFWLKVDWLWQEPLPDEVDVLGRLGILER